MTILKLYIFGPFFERPSRNSKNSFFCQFNKLDHTLVYLVTYDIGTTNIDSSLFVVEFLNCVPFVAVDFKRGSFALQKQS